MTEEENKAIERCNELIKDEHKEWIGMSNQEAIKIALNLIEKLQKENEEKDKKILGRKFYEVDLNELLKENYIRKDKIRKELEELKNKEQELSDGQGYWGSSDLQAQIEILEDILEEEE